MSSQIYDECRIILDKIATVNDAWNDVIKMMDKYEKSKDSRAELSIEAGGERLTLTLSESQTRGCVGIVNENYQREIERFKDKLNEKICYLSRRRTEVAPVQQK
jgi:hypothetical protein